MRTIAKVGIGLGAGLASFLGYEYWKSSQPRQKVAISQAIARYGAGAHVWNTEIGTPVPLPFKTPPHSYVMGLGLVPNVDPQQGYEGPLAMWLATQLTFGNCVYITTRSSASLGGSPVYIMTVNDPKPPIDSIEIVAG